MSSRKFETITIFLLTILTVICLGAFYYTGTAINGGSSAVKSLYDSTEIKQYDSLSAQKNRDAVKRDLSLFAKMAQQYYRKPVDLGGGGNSFNGWRIPPQLESTPNGSYKIEALEENKEVLAGTGNEIGNDKINRVKVVITIEANSSSTEIIN